MIDQIVCTNMYMKKKAGTAEQGELNGWLII